MEAKQIIKMQSVYKYHYTDEIETAALNGIDLEINEGEFVAVMGPSGSGKSTLLNVIGMIDKMSKGSYHFDGQEIKGLSQQERANIRKGAIGFVFQSFNLIDELTAYENVELPLIYLKIPIKERKKHVLQALEALEMSHRRDHYPQQLSGGQQQRIAIARATVISPRLILADEPTGNLDSKNSQAVMNILTDLHRAGSTIVMVTHSDHDATYAERTIQLFDGNVLQEENEYLET